MKTDDHGMPIVERSEPLRWHAGPYPTNRERARADLRELRRRRGARWTKPTLLTRKLRRRGRYVSQPQPRIVR